MGFISVVWSVDSAAPYSIKKLETFMCRDVASRFGNEEALFVDFFALLDQKAGDVYV